MKIMRDTINQSLSALDHERDVRVILLAVKGGSRAQEIRVR
jgi:hypothetical protein